MRLSFSPRGAFRSTGHNGRDDVFVFSFTVRGLGRPYVRVRSLRPAVHLNAVGRGRPQVSRDLVAAFSVVMLADVWSTRHAAGPSRHHGLAARGPARGVSRGRRYHGAIEQPFGLSELMKLGHCRFANMTEENTWPWTSSPTVCHCRTDQCLWLWHFWLRSSDSIRRLSGFPDRLPPGLRNPCIFLSTTTRRGYGCAELVPPSNSRALWALAWFLLVYHSGFWARWCSRLPRSS